MSPPVRGACTEPSPKPVARPGIVRLGEMWVPRSRQDTSQSGTWASLAASDRRGRSCLVRTASRPREMRRSHDPAPVIGPSARTRARGRGCPAGAGCVVASGHPCGGRSTLRRGGAAQVSSNAVTGQVWGPAESTYAVEMNRSAWFRGRWHGVHGCGRGHMCHPERVPRAGHRLCTSRR